jgi:hypothetical protein
VSTLQEQVTEGQEKVSSLQEQVSGLVSQELALQGQVTSLQAQCVYVGELQGRVDGLLEGQEGASVLQVTIKPTIYTPIKPTIYI